MIVNVRGTHGSGKTTISHRLINEHPHEALVEPAEFEGTSTKKDGTVEPYLKRFKKANAHRIPGAPGSTDLIIVGRYQSGCDGILPQEIIEDMLRYWAPQGHLVWENVLVSANVGRWGRLETELREAGNPSVWAHLDTPADVCLARVEARREAAKAEGFHHRQVETKHNVHMAHWKRCRRAACYAKRDHGIDVRWIKYELAYEMVHDLLVHNGWQCPVHGLLLPEGPWLTAWQPTPEELEYTVKTCLFPGEPQPETSFARVRQAKPTALGVAQAVTMPIQEFNPLAEIGDPFDS